MAGFSGALGSLWVEIGARITDFENKMQQVSATVATTVKETEAKFEGFNKLGSTLTGIGSGLTASLTLPIVGIGAAALKASGDFDTAMRLVSARGDITGGNLERLARQAEELGAKTKFSGREAAEGMAEFAGAGFSVDEIYSSLPGTLDLAAASQTSVGAAAISVADMLGQFGLAASDTGHAVDVLAKAGNLSKGSLESMSSSLRTVGPVAKNAGMSIEDTAAALLVLDKAGIRGEMSGTALKGMLANLSAVTPQAAASMEKLGVKITDANGKFLPFAAIMESAKQGLTTVGNEAEKSGHLVNIFGTQGLAAATVLSNEGAKGIGFFRDQLNQVGGESKRTADVMNSGMGGALEKMKGSVETAAQKLGDVLAPTVIKLAGFIETAANQVAEFARWFNTLPEPIKTTALAFVALVAVIGPALLIAGQFASSITTIATSLSLMSKGITAASKFLGVGSLALAGYTIAITAAAVAIGTIIIKYNQWQDAEKDLEKARDLTATSMIRLERHLRDQGGAVDALKKQLKDNNITQKEYEAGLRKMAIEIGNTKKATADTTKELTAEEKALKALADGVVKTAEGHKKAKEHADHFSASQARLVLTTKAVRDASLKALEADAKWIVSHQTLESVTPKLTQVTDDLTASITEMISEAKQIVPSFANAGEQAMASMEKALAPIRAVDAAFKELSITSTQSLQTQVNEAEKSYDLITKAASASAEDRAEALEKLEARRAALQDRDIKSAIPAAIAAAATISEEQQKVFDETEEKLENSHKNQKNQWKDFSQQVSTIISDAGKNIIGRFSELSDFNKNLDTQSEKIRESLAEREADFVAFTVSVAESLEEAHAGYEETLLKEEQSLNDSLNERRQDYEDFSKDVLTKIDDLRKDHERASQKERDAIQDGLDDRTQDYGDYTEDIEKKILDQRRTHDESADKERRDLANSLKDRTIDYNRYVEDVNTKLLRIREKNKGQFSEEEADLLKSLQRRTEDFAAYQAENATKVGEVTKKHQDEAARQEQDNRDALARKLRDFEEYQADVAEKLGAVAAKHKEEQEKEETDLLKSLDRKRDDLSKYETDAIAKFETIREGAREKLEKQEADLREKLANQTAEWTKYKDSVMLELQGIEDKHLGIFGKIAEVGKGIFADLGLAIGRFVSEYLVGQLFKALGDLVTDVLPGVGKALSDIFGKSGGAIGKATDAAGSVAGAGVEAGGGAAGTAGQAAGGIASGGVTAIVGAVGSVASAVSGIIGNFQSAKMETTLNAIEESTRYMKIWTGEGSYSILQNTGKVPELLGYLNTTSDAIGRKMDDWLSPLTGQLLEIESKAGWSLQKLDEISNNSHWGSAAEKDNTSLLTQMLNELRVMASKSPVINVYVAGVLQPSSTTNTALKMQGVLGI